MNVLEEKIISCPYCGEDINVLIDASIPEQQYVEDCQVCCRPINFIVNVDVSSGVTVNVSHENE